MNKLKSEEELLIEIDKARKQNKKIVTTNGSFDILHPAHLSILEKARNEGDLLIVLLNSDNSIKKLKGPKRPILSQSDRTKMLSGLACVDYITIFDEDNPLKLIQKIKPDIHAKGGKFEPERIKKEQELLKSWNGKFTHFEIIEDYSTTKIIETILERNN